VALQNKLAKQKLGALLVTGGKNIRYLSGFSGSAGMLLVSRQGAVLFTDGRYSLQAKAEVNGVDPCSEPGTRVRISNKPLPILKRLLGRLKISRLGIEAQHLTVAAYNKLQKLLAGTAQVIVSQDLVEKLRLVKDAAELEYIKQAAQIAGAAFASIRGDIQPGVSEKELAGKLECALKAKGSDNIPFEIIVASGCRSAMPHGIASDKQLAERELVVIDFGASVAGYSADISRTLILGKAGAEQKKIYQAVAKAQARGIEAVKPGVKAARIDQITRSVIEQAGYGKYFSHSTGHGLGLEVHEAPSISKGDKTVLKEGMVFTVEPGVYLPGVGGVRIEDMLLVTADGCQVLSAGVENFLTGLTDRL